MKRAVWEARQLERHAYRLRSPLGRYLVLIHHPLAAAKIAENTRKIGRVAAATVGKGVLV